MIAFLFNFLFFLVPVAFWPWSSEVFEFNKIVLVYGFSVVIVVAWTLKMIRERTVLFRRTMLDVPLLLFIFSQLVSTLLSIDSRTSWLGYYSRFNGGLYSTLAYCVLYWAYVSNMNKEQTLKVIRTLLISAVIVSLWGALEHFGHSPSCLVITGTFDVACWVQKVQLRVFATIGQPNWLAAWLVAVVPLAWAKARNTKSQTLNWGWVGGATLFFAILLFTKSRSGLLGMGVAFGVFWIFYFLRSMKMFLVLVGAYCLLVVVVGTPWSPNISEMFGKYEALSTKPEVVGTMLEIGGTESGDIRKIVWRGAVDVWKNYPVFGTGVETFAYSYWQYRPVEHNNTSEWNFIYNKAHNEYLNFAANTGSVGLFSYLLLIGVAIWIMKKQPRFLAGYTSILVTNFFGFSVVPISLLFFLYPAMAVTFQISNSKSQASSKHKVQNTKYQMVQIGVLLVGGYLLFAIGRYWQADLLYAQSRRGQSTKVLKRAIELQPGEAHYHSELAGLYGRAALEAQKTDGGVAFELSEKAMEETMIVQKLSPRNVKLLKSKAALMGDLSVVEPTSILLAIRDWNALTKLAPTDPKVYFALGASLLKAGEEQKAIEMIRYAVELKPDYLQARDVLDILVP